MYHWRHLLHAIRPDNPSAPSILRILFADIKDKKKLQEKYTEFLSLFSFFIPQYETVVMPISLWHIGALGFNHWARFSFITPYFM
jgi:hypothetical protein